MKKIIKVFLIILIVLCFNVNVYASGEMANVCYTMPGVQSNNSRQKMIIPKDFHARCVYSLNVTKSGVINKQYNGNEFLYPTDYTNYDDTIKKLYFDYYKYKTDTDGVYTDHIIMYYDTLSDDYNYNEDDYTSGQKLIEFDIEPKRDSGLNSIYANVVKGSNTFNFNGFQLNEGAIFSNANNALGTIKYNSTGNCPKSIYFIVRNPDDSSLGGHKNSQEEAMFRFSDLDNVSTTEKMNNVGGVVHFFELNFMGDGDIADLLLISNKDDEEGNYVSEDDHDVSIFWGDSDEEYLTYNDAVELCNGNVDGPNGNTGHDDSANNIAEVVSEETYVCNYKFEVPQAKDCGTRPINITYNLSKIHYKNTNKTETRLDSTVDFPDFEIVNNFVNVEKLDDFLKLDPKTGKYSCVKTVYAYDNGSKYSIFGQSSYEFVNSVFADRIILKSLKEFSGKCNDDILDDILGKDEQNKPNNNNNNNNNGFDWEFSEDETCEGVLGKDLVDFMNKIFRWICIIAPIIVIVLGSVDFAGAVLQDDKDALKKASTKFIKRLIIAIALFFIPIFLNFLFDIYHQVTGKTIVLCKIWR